MSSVQEHPAVIIQTSVATARSIGRDPLHFSRHGRAFLMLSRLDDEIADPLATPAEIAVRSVPISSAAHS